MAKETEYNRDAAVAYAREWSHARNPRYYNFDSIGGDCTNFISQCVYAGSGVMNTTPEVGWYYFSLGSRAAAWTGVQYFYNFMTSNKGRGPYGYEAELSAAEPGDVVQLSFASGRFSHSLLVVDAGKEPSPGNILIATHTLDSFGRPVGTYVYNEARLIKIAGVRK